MSEQVKKEKTLLLGFYQGKDGDVEVESSVDPWIEGELGNILLQRSRNTTQTLLDNMLRREYERLSKNNK